ncbi:hypothetical protein PUR59_01880 [Streptomyces sp. SP18ES09]|uniref:hypothetical protein n=1 Tax=Streptomyces sp. SP18ES09 TaxID=3002532 RepID=UPI002E7A401E|nr:hypothetical protein [Streptomyces sp. SP18ES09]MEE1813787.1 hypothetical protein [Streptomyces sp. SP18ES09]
MRLLVDTATSDEGRRISVHLADQDGMLLVVVLSHTTTTAVGADDTVLAVLADLAAVPGTASCGTDTSDEGRRVWTVLSTEHPRTRTPAS